VYPSFAKFITGSSAPPPLKRTPRLAAAAIAERIAAGVLMTRAQGEATVISVIAR
jgi:hypothetical protein